MSKSNIVLIGMMGCGKTTIGRILAQKLDMNFIDLDFYIEEKWGPISELFKKGEPFFRDIESQAVNETSITNNTVISTGGGVILRNDNVTRLKENGVIVFIDRPLEDILNDIDTKKRPLIKDGKEKLKDIFKNRYQIYINSSDIIINKRDINEAINDIIEKFDK